MKLLRVCCIALVLSICCKATGVYPQVRETNAPQLVIDSGGHTATVTAVAFTNDDRYLVSAGRDKIVRVWDLKTGKTVRIIRGEIGAGQWGAIHAADLTPNNRFLAVGGQLASDDDAAGIGTVRVHEFSDQKSDGEVRAQLSSLPNVVTALTTSPRNTYVAAGDILGNVCVWRLSPPAPTSSLVRCTKLHEQRITALTFSPDERKLVAASWDKTLSLSAIPALQVTTVMKEHTDRVISAVFRDGGIVSSSYDGTIRQWDDNGKHQRILLKAADQLIGNLAVDAQLRRALFCSSGNFVVCEILNVRSGNVVAKFGKLNSVSAAAMSHDGTMAATAGGYNNEIYVWKTDTGAPVQTMGGTGALISAVGFAKDGSSIAFTPQRAANGNSNLLLQKLTFRNPGQGTVTFRNLVERQDDYFRDIHNSSGIELRLRNNETLEVVRGGKVETTIRREPGNGSFHSAYTLTPDSKFIVSGGAGGFLALYDLRGNEIRRYPGHTGNITSVSVSRDGKTIVSGSSDQLIKMWDLEKQTGNLLGTTFVASDDEWVTWIPEGYYVSSIHGDRYAGWQINNGLKAPRYAPFIDYSAAYYDPARVADKLANHASPPPITASVPPLVVIEKAQFEDNRLIIRAKATSERDEVRDIRVFLGGTPVGITSPPTTNLRERIAEAKVSRPDWQEHVEGGTIVVEAEAQTRFAKATSPKIVLKLPPPPPDTPPDKPTPPKPRLFVLAIGVSRYQMSGISLQHPADDAQQLVQFFLKQKTNGFFQDVTVETLLNEKANRMQMIEKLDWLTDAPRDGDIRVLFLSGHGLIDRRDYYFGGYGYNPQQSVDLTSISWRDIFRRFDEAVGKTLLIVDTCHAGGIVSGPRRGLIASQDITDMLKILAKNPTRGFVTLAASTSEEKVPDESVFFKSLLSGLSGKAISNSGKKYVDVADLATFVSKEVSDLTKNQQHVIVHGTENGGWPLLVIP